MTHWGNFILFTNLITPVMKLHLWVYARPSKSRLKTALTINNNTMNLQSFFFDLTSRFFVRRRGGTRNPSSDIYPVNLKLLTNEIKT
jgi:hypothetical protein